MISKINDLTQILDQSFRILFRCLQIRQVRHLNKCLNFFCKIRWAFLFSFLSLNIYLELFSFSFSHSDSPILLCYSFSQLHYLFCLMFSKIWLMSSKFTLLLKTKTIITCRNISVKFTDFLNVQICFYSGTKRQHTGKLQ